MLKSSDVVKAIIAISDIVTRYQIDTFDVIPRYNCGIYPKCFKGVDDLIGGLFDLSYRGFSIESFRLNFGLRAPVIRINIYKDSTTNIDESVIEALSTRFKL